jgi:hypothetical protein
VDREVVKERLTFRGEQNLETPTTGLEATPSGKGTPMLKVFEGGKFEKPKERKMDAERARAAVAAVAAGGLVLPMDLDELAREGARVMLKHALRIEADHYVER